MWDAHAHCCYGMQLLFLDHVTIFSNKTARACILRVSLHSVGLHALLSLQALGIIVVEKTIPNEEKSIKCTLSAQPPLL